MDPIANITKLKNNPLIRFFSLFSYEGTMSRQIFIPIIAICWIVLFFCGQKLESIMANAPQELTSNKQDLQSLIKTNRHIDADKAAKEVKDPEKFFQEFISVILCVIVMAITLGIFFSSICKRLHDMGYSGWLQLVILGICIFLSLAKSIFIVKIISDIIYFGFHFVFLPLFPPKVENNKYRKL